MYTEEMYGGVNLRNLHSNYHSLLAKQAFNIFQPSTSTWLDLLKDKYNPQFYGPIPKNAHIPGEHYGTPLSLFVPILDFWLEMAQVPLQSLVALYSYCLFAFGI